MTLHDVYLTDSNVSEPRPGYARPFKRLYTHPVSELLAEREQRKILAEKSTIPPFIPVSVDSTRLSGQVAKNKSMTRWPQMSTIIMKETNYKGNQLHVSQAGSQDAPWLY
jgi:hypothetical protein